MGAFAGCWPEGACALAFAPKPLFEFPPNPDDCENTPELLTPEPLPNPDPLLPNPDPLLPNPDPLLPNPVPPGPEPFAPVGEPAGFAPGMLPPPMLLLSFTVGSP